MTVRSVGKGERVSRNLSASTWNAFVRAANANDLRRDLGPRQQADVAEMPYVTVKVKPSTNVARREVVAIDTPAILPANGAQSYRTRRLFSGVTPSLGAFALMEQAGAPNVYTKAISGGIVECKLFVPQFGDWISRADIDTTDATRLLATPNGSAQILWKDTGTDTVVDAIVRLGNPQNVALVGKSQGTIPHDSTGTMIVWLNGVTTNFPITVHLDWMEDDQDITDDKEMGALWFPDENLWRVMWAECEDTGSSGNTLPMSWNGDFQQTIAGTGSAKSLEGPPYEPGWVMQDDGWLMVANKQTSDRPAPQAITQPKWTLPDSGLVSSAQTGSEDIYYVGNRYIFNQGLWIDRWRAWIPGQDAGAIIQFQALLLKNRGLANEQLNFTAWYDDAAQGYTEFPIGKTIFLSGDIIEVWLAIRSIATPSQFTGTWQYERKNGNADEGKVWHQSGGGGNEIRFNQVDDADVNRSTDLGTIGIGSTIAISGYEWTVTSASTSGDNYIFGVTPAVRAQEDTYLFTFTTFGAGDITYDFTTNYWTGNQPVVATASGAATNVDPLATPPTWGNNAYSGDIQFTQAGVSPDWDYMTFDGLS